MSDHRPAAIRPAAPSTWASVTSSARRRRRPSAIGHQPHQRERPHHDLRRDQQYRDGVDTPQRGRSAVRVGEVVLGGLGARRPWRIHHRDRAHDGGHRAHRGGEQQRRRYAVVLGEPGNHQRAQPDSQRLGRLPDAHHQPALMRREPADHQPAAGRVAAGRGHSAEQQERADREQRVHRRGREGRGRGQRRPDAPTRCARLSGRRRSPMRSA